MKELTALNKLVSEKVGESLVELMTESDWNNLIEKEIIKFKTETAPGIVSDILHTALTKQVEDIVSELVNLDEFSDMTQQFTSAKLREFLTAHHGEMIASILMPASQQAIVNLRSQLINGY